MLPSNQYYSLRKKIYENDEGVVLVVSYLINWFWLTFHSFQCNPGIHEVAREGSYFNSYVTNSEAGVTLKGWLYITSDYIRISGLTALFAWLFQIYVEKMETIQGVKAVNVTLYPRWANRSSFRWFWIGTMITYYNDCWYRSILWAATWQLSLALNHSICTWEAESSPSHSGTLDGRVCDRCVRASSCEGWMAVSWHTRNVTPRCSGPRAEREGICLASLLGSPYEKNALNTWPCWNHFQYLARSVSIRVHWTWYCA